MLSRPSTLSQTSIHVALVDDDVEFQRALIASISNTPDIKLWGTAATRAQGLAMLEQPPADVLLVDLGLPDGSGIDVIRAAQKQWPECLTMVSTIFGDEAHVIRSLEAGACGYLLKDSTAEQLVSEIRNLHAGGSPISPLIARQVLRRFHGADTFSADLGQNINPKEERVALSAREREVLGYITKGFTSNEIAGLMSVTYYTVQTYVRRIYEKLKVNSKAEAIYETRRQGLLRR